ncbi:hypothetical protein ACQP3F_28125, partial [Escherichia coli]
EVTLKPYFLCDKKGRKKSTVARDGDSIEVEQDFSSPTEDLSSEPQNSQKNITQGRGGRVRRIPRACWPANPAESVSSKFSEKLSKIKCRARQWWLTPLISTCGRKRQVDL